MILAQKQDIFVQLLCHTHISQRVSLHELRINDVIVASQVYRVYLHAKVNFFPTGLLLFRLLLAHFRF